MVIIRFFLIIIFIKFLDVTKYLYICLYKCTIIQFLAYLKIYFNNAGDIMSKTLKDVEPGEIVTIVKYHDTGDAGLKRHLLGMGFVKGAELKVKKVATLGNPIELSVKGYDICLRKEEAQHIEVE